MLSAQHLLYKGTSCRLLLACKDALRWQTVQDSQPGLPNDTSWHAFCVSRATGRCIVLKLMNFDLPRMLVADVTDM